MVLTRRALAPVPATGDGERMWVRGDGGGDSGGGGDGCLRRRRRWRQTDRRMAFRGSLGFGVSGFAGVGVSGLGCVGVT
eukprot:scaffold4740_cov59-Phaeocystis_antarctica.AAC.7